MEAISLAHCAQVAQSAEVAQVVGNGEWLSTAEAAEVIGCSTSHVIKLIDEGTLPGTRVGNRRRVLADVAVAYRNKLRREAGGEAPGRHAAS